MRLVAAAGPGRLREGLPAMLHSFLASGSVVVVDDGPGALAAIQAGRPELAIHDGQLLDGGAE
jgi:hypothetical protein